MEAQNFHWDSSIIYSVIDHLFGVCGKLMILFYNSKIKPVIIFSVINSVFH